MGFEFVGQCLLVPRNPDIKAGLKHARAQVPVMRDIVRDLRNDDITLGVIRLFGDSDPNTFENLETAMGILDMLESASPRNLRRCFDLENYRDIASRDVIIGGLSYRIYYSGEMSFGEPPEEMGYITLTRFIRSGLAEAIGCI